MTRATSLAIAFILVLAACGGETGEPTTSTDSPSPTETPPPVEIEREAAWPPERLHPTLVHDPVGETMVMLSGISRMQRDVDMRDLWSLDTDDFSWNLIGDIEPFDALINFGVDIESGQIITLNMSPVQTWSYDLANHEWEQRETAEQPESTSTNPRFGAPLTYDAESDRLILFAGGSPWHMYNDTWAYDSNTNTWEQMHPAAGPSPRAMYATAYDAESDRVLIWGGFTGTEENDVNMWAYDYNADTWETLENSEGPQQHWERHGMAYIPEVDRVLFYSGMLEDDGVLPAETWYYDYNTNTWNELHVKTSPPKLAMYAMAYDPAISKPLIYGGERTSKYAGDISRDIWVFDPVAENWTQVPAPASP